MKILLVGGGGREHALAWKISQSPLCDKLYIAPGNAMMKDLGECVAIPADDCVALKYFAKKEDIDLTIVGPEVPLVEGIVNIFEAEKMKIFGPRRAAAQLEGSKIYSKEIMKKYHIPTAKFQVVQSYDQAKETLEVFPAPVVIKADGLAEGKGAFVCKTDEEAKEALRIIYSEKRFGEAGARCIFESFLSGEEASLFILTDGNTIIPMLAAQDHKAVGDGDTGPNTGGMGSYAPAPIMTPETLDRVLEEIVVPTIHAMNEEGTPYKGLLYVGLMIDNENDEINVVEYNCRFGDPETQPLMMLLKSDIVPIFDAIAGGELDESMEGLEWHDGAAIGVVLASAGYPGSYEKGKTITGLDDLESTVAFAAGVQGSPSGLKSSGGRVLCVTGMGEDLNGAREKVYGEIDRVKFEGAFYRKDIGDKGL
jgi:phosphoribosylamine---glycine ligase